MMISRWSFCGSIAAAAVAGSAPSVGAELAAIRVGTLGTDATLEAYYGTQAGILQRAGLSVETSKISGGGGAMAAAILGNTLDSGFVSLLTVAQARLRGVPLFALAPAVIAATARPTTVMCQAKDATFRTGAELNGKRIAVSTLNTETSVAAQAWIEKTGGDPNSVQFVEMPFPVMAEALARQRVSAAMIAEPFVSAGRDEIKLLADAFAAIAPNVMLGVFAATSSFVSQSHDTARRFVTGMAATARWANVHAAETAAMLVKYTGLDAATVARVSRPTFAETLDPVYITPLLEAAQRYGVLKTPIKAADIVATV
jgi:NitT/TauT family transport system substrate-binding protein